MVFPHYSGIVDKTNFWPDLALKIRANPGFIRAIWQAYNKLTIAMQIKINCPVSDGMGEVQEKHTVFHA